MTNNMKKFLETASKDEALKAEMNAFAGGLAHCGCGVAGGGGGDGRSCGCGFLGFGSVHGDPPRLVCIIIGVVA